MKKIEKTLNLIFINIFLKLANHPALLLTSTETFESFLSKNLSAYLTDDKLKQFKLIENCGKLKVY